MRTKSSIPFKHFGILLARFRSVVFIGLCVCVVSCKNDTATVLSLDAVPNEPELVVKKSTMLHSENGRVKMKIESPVIHSFEGQTPRTEYPKGIFVTFFNSDKSIGATLSADSAISNSLTRIMEARKNVVIINYQKHDTIYTEEIIWNQNEKKIYSNTRLRSIGAKDTIYGDGFESSEDLKDYRVKNPRGRLEWSEQKDSIQAGGNNTTP